MKRFCPRLTANQSSKQLEFCLLLRWHQTQSIENSFLVPEYATYYSCILSSNKNTPLRTIRIKVEMAVDESNVGYFLFCSLGNAKSNLSQCQTAILDLSTERYTFCTGYMPQQGNSLGNFGHRIT